MYETSCCLLDFSFFDEVCYTVRRRTHTHCTLFRELCTIFSLYTKVIEYDSSTTFLKLSLLLVFSCFLLFATRTLRVATLSHCSHLNIYDESSFLREKKTTTREANVVFESINSIHNFRYLSYTKHKFRTI